MNQNPSSNLRTVAFVGHGAAGKTTLVEALLAATGTIQNRGWVEKGNTICDFDPQEKELGHSIYSSIVHLTWQGARINIIDAPGYPEFAGQSVGALAAVDTVMIVVNAQTGIELSAERMMRRASARNLCRMIVINKIDAENIDLPKLVATIQERFGRECMLLDLPVSHGHEVIDLLRHSDGESDFESVTESHRALIDQIIEEDENLLARYLDEGEEPTPDELHAPFEKALRAGHLIPILFVSAKTGAGIPQLLDVLGRLAPDPSESNPPPFFKGEPPNATEFRALPDPDKHVLAHVFKIVSDPFIGKLGIFRVYQGTLRKDAQLYVGSAKRPFKVNHLFRLFGKEHSEVDALYPGDIGGIAKVDEIEFDSVLHDSHDEDHIYLHPLEFPQPMQGLAVETKKKADEQRLFDVLHKLEIEDPCFKVERHATTNETVIRGLGEMHLRAKLSRMAQQYKIELATKPPQIDYRETITANAPGHCRHKKQSGGAGQFGEVMLRVEPLARGAGFEFVDEVKGGAIPGVFMASVEKGVRQALTDGVVAGFPVQDIRVIVSDGKSHPVDSKDIAFFTAGRKAAIAAIHAASPIILEPIVEIEIAVPEHSVGDIAGDLSGKRGQVTGTQPRGNEMVAVNGKVPLSELDGYQGRLKSLTGGKGTFVMFFSHYAPVPANTQQQLAAQHKTTDSESD
ncbi:MAG: elongation factor G [Candidatus Accumulibacter sp.]|jgi:elongation factor G|nr:elongation factor G [Accumulibacter sp.]